MDNDDLPVGRILTRREAMALIAAAGGTIGLAGLPRPAAAKSPTSGPTLSCVVRPESTEGPFFLDAKHNRSDIRAEPTTGALKAGTLLALRIGVHRVDGETCAPLRDVAVDVWHCDADGEYSGFVDPAQDLDRRGLSFLRGYQLSDAQGNARFTTIYPGWYPGRAVHIHVKLRHQMRPGQVYEFTSQFYFDGRLTEGVLANAPYRKTDSRYIPNERDGLYQREGGNQLMLAIQRHGEGLHAEIDVGLDLSDPRTGAADAWGARRP